jgi:hypothetical protein
MLFDVCKYSVTLHVCYIRNISLRSIVLPYLDLFGVKGKGEVVPVLN